MGLRVRIAVIAAVAAACLMAVSTGDAFGQASFVIVHDEQSVKDLLPILTEGAGAASFEKADVYKDDGDGKAALLVTGEGGDGQKFRTSVPGWAWKIKKDPNPKAKDEFRYITFAWRKVGGTGIQLQLHAPDANTWGHRYHAGANEKGWNPSIEIAPKIPEQWAIVTRDLFTDWKEFTLDGIAFTAWSLKHGIWDHVVLHQTEEDPLGAKAVEPSGKAASAWARLKVER
ncbi:hypothetical protein FJZ36_05195 [Candidatus Poribacteria bacterium]|nr:hypothetical protein [Candidatus Poribacteria bacterium]